MSKENEFNKSLINADSTEVTEFLEDFYKKYFPNIAVYAKAFSTRNHSQLMGIDTVIFLTNLKTITIDEKIRYDVYDDYAIEVIKNNNTKQKGWMEEDMSLDYLNYVQFPIRRATMFNWPTLRRTYILNKEKWFKEYGLVPASNYINGRFVYDTMNLIVPKNVLLEEYQKNMTITYFSDEEVNEYIKNNTIESKQKQAIERIKELRNGQK